MVFNKIRFFLVFLFAIIPTLLLLITILYEAYLYKYAKNIAILKWFDWKLHHIESKALMLWIKLSGIRVYTMDDDPSKWMNDPTLILSNHLNTFDSLMMTIFSAADYHHSFYYHKLDKKFWWIANHNKERGQYVGQNGPDKAKDFEEHLKKNFFPMYHYSIIYPEGGMLKNVAKKSEEYARKHNIPQFKHLALPHIKGTQAVLNALLPIDGDESGDLHGMRLKWVVDQTIIYSDEKISVEQLFQPVKKQSSIYLYRKVYDAKEIPRDDEKLTKWMYERFREKDEILENYKINGKLPTDKPLGTLSPYSIPLFIFFLIYLWVLYNLTYQISSLILSIFN